MEDKQAEEIVKIFQEAGLKIELGAQYSVKGQIAQLLNGCGRLLELTHNLEFKQDARGKCSCEFPFLGVPGCPVHNPSKLERTS